LNTAIDKFTDFAISLKFEDIPAEVIERAKDCVIDTVGACVYGAELPWTKIVIGYAQRNSSAGMARIFWLPWSQVTKCSTAWEMPRITRSRRSDFTLPQ